MQAKLETRNPCVDGLVLQQQTSAVFWGKATPGASVNVTPSWGSRVYVATADADGIFRAYLDTPAASYKAYEIKVEGDGGRMVVKDVLVGEVWLASGQSNMEMPIRGFDGCPVEGAADAITAAPAPDRIRMFTVPTTQSFKLEEDVQGVWRKACPDDTPEMSATAYFYARKLNEVLDVPVGIVNFAFGGSHVESWLPREILQNYKDIDLSEDAINKTGRWDRPMLMYNAMAWPLRGFTAKGFIWYQGCSNVGQHDRFVDRFSTMVGQWRTIWGDTDARLPFYTVEIAGYNYGGDSGAFLRQAQHDAVKVIPNSGIVVTNDLNYSYELNQIHPARKKEVGERLAYFALNRDYGFKRVACYSPEAVSLEKGANPGEIVVKFENAQNGFDRVCEIQALEVCGPDGVYVPVTEVAAANNAITIKAAGIDNPCGVRYGWGDFKPGNLHNIAGLPVAPFNLKL